MRTRRRHRAHWLIRPLTLVFASACGIPGADAGALPIVRAAVPGSVPRVEFTQLHGGPHHGRITDFELRGDTLDLLDGADGEISEYRLVSNRSWTFTHVAADRLRDSVPLSLASGMAIDDGTMIIVQGDATIWRLATAGHPDTAVHPALGCLVRQADIVAMSNGVLLISGTCLDADGVVREILWRQQPDGRFTRLAADVRFSLDGSRGYLLASTHALAATSSGAVFGIGTTNCLWIIDTAAAITPTRRCALVAAAYRAADVGGPEDNTLAAFRTQHHVVGHAFEWHPELPLYLAHLQAGDVTVLARRVAEDTLVLVPVNASIEGPPLVSGPVGTFLGCKRGGCVWFQRTNAANWVSAVTADSLSWLLSSRDSTPDTHGGS